MNIRTVALISMPAVLVTAGGISTAAQSAEAYLCGKDNAVYVEQHELEELKRTNACIAAYYGLKVKQPVAKQPEAASKIIKPRSKTERPRTIARKQSPEKSSPAFSSLAKKSISDANELPKRHRRVARHTAPKARTAPGTDFRNVRIINAQNPEDGWYRHTN